MLSAQYGAVCLLQFYRARIVRHRLPVAQNQRCQLFRRIPLHNTGPQTAHGTGTQNMPVGPSGVHGRVGRDMDW